jgi:hypothetical protein
MKRQRVRLLEVSGADREPARKDGYRIRIGDRVEVDVPRGFDSGELVTLLLMVKEAEL